MQSGRRFVVLVPKIRRPGGCHRAARGDECRSRSQNKTPAISQNKPPCTQKSANVVGPVFQAPLAVAGLCAEAVVSETRVAGCPCRIFTDHQSELKLLFFIALLDHRLLIPPAPKRKNEHSHSGHNFDQSLPRISTYGMTEGSSGALTTGPRATTETQTAAVPPHG